MLSDFRDSPIGPAIQRFWIAIWLYGTSDVVIEIDVLKRELDESLCCHGLKILTRSMIVDPIPARPKECDWR